MQGAQTESRYWGTGSFTIAFAQAVVRNHAGHEIILALSGLFPDTIEPIRACFRTLLAQKNIRVWYAPGPVREVESGNKFRREVAEIIREAFLASLHPDIIHISSLFEGFRDDGVISIGKFDKITPVSVTLFRNPTSLQNDQKIKKPEAYKKFINRKKNYLNYSFYNLPVKIKKCKKNCWNLSSYSKEYIDKIAKGAFYNWKLQFLNQTRRKAKVKFNFKNKPRLAYVSPLPPQRTGVADYSAELLPALSRYYQIELITDQESINLKKENFYNFKNKDWLRVNVSKDDRVLYHFGNSPFHSYMFDLLQEIPGVVVMHDLFFGHVLRHESSSGTKSYEWERELYRSHGYKAIKDLSKQNGAEQALLNYPCSGMVVQNSSAIVVHSWHAKSLIKKWYGKIIYKRSYVVPHVRIAKNGEAKNNLRQRLGLKPDEFIVCSFGYLQQSKMNDRLLIGWSKSRLSKDQRCRLIFVGENTGGPYGKRLLKIIQQEKMECQVTVTGFVPTDKYRDYLGAMDAAVQLRTSSRGETSGAVLDVMAAGKPLIVNAHGSLSELDPDAVCVLPDNFSDLQLSQALDSLFSDSVKKQASGNLAKKIISRDHAPEKICAAYFKILETAFQNSRKPLQEAINAIATQIICYDAQDHLIDISRCIASTWPLKNREKNLFLDISGCCLHDLKTGIERVTKGLLCAFLDQQSIRCEPIRLVYENKRWVYRYARKYTSGILEIPQILEDELPDFLPGDILLTLDLSGRMFIGAEQQGLIRDLRNQGVKCYHVVYDLLPVKTPQFFPHGASQTHEEWMRSVSNSDGVFCISKSVAEEFEKWIIEKKLRSETRLPFSVEWFRLSPEITTSSPSIGMPSDAHQILRQIGENIAFLMVGTIEPRKGYLQTLEAFDILWAKGVDVILVIVGKEGWLEVPPQNRRDIPATVQRIKNHAQLGRRLFWLNGISDEYLEKVYSASTCLISASFGEGFGLPIIEAAQKKIALLLRDIDVFREVAGKSADYFKANSSDQMAEVIQNWIEKFKKGIQITPNNLPYSTWEESVYNILQKINN